MRVGILIGFGAATGNHECGMCLDNSVFNGVLGVSITTPEVVKFCCDCVCV